MQAQCPDEARRRGEKRNSKMIVAHPGDGGGNGDGSATRAVQQFRVQLDCLTQSKLAAIRWRQMQQHASAAIVQHQASAPVPVRSFDLPFKLYLEAFLAAALSRNRHTSRPRSHSSSLRRPRSS
jgi:hypothetical protein